MENNTQQSGGKNPEISRIMFVGFDVEPDKDEENSKEENDNN